MSSYQHWGFYDEDEIVSRPSNTFVQVMAWCLTTPSHYLKQCSPYIWKDGLYIETGLENSLVSMVTGCCCLTYVWVAFVFYTSLSTRRIVCKYIGTENCPLDDYRKEKNLCIDSWNAAKFVEISSFILNCVGCIVHKKNVDSLIRFKKNE